MFKKILAVSLFPVIMLVLSLLIILPGYADPTQPAQILLRQYHFDPLQGEPALPVELSLAGPVSSVTPWLVQFSGPIQEEWKAALGQAGGRLYDYLPENAFLVRMDDAAAERVRSLRFVRWVGPYHPAYRIQPGLEQINANSTVELDIQVYPDTDFTATQAALEALGGTVSAAYTNEWSGFLRAQLPAGAIADVARRDEVIWIEQYVPPVIQNDTSRTIMNAPRIWQGLGLYGAGQVVAVCDTGLDTGNEGTLSNDFQPQLLHAYALGRAGDWSDDNGHGTHVAGSVLGNGALSGSNPSAHDYAASFAGVAPEAGLIFQSVLDSGGGLGGIPADLNDLFTPAYNDGARIHTNSWGAALAGQYNTRAG